MIKVRLIIISLIIVSITFISSCETKNKLNNKETPVKSANNQSNVDITSTLENIETTILTPQKKEVLKKTELEFKGLKEGDSLDKLIAELGEPNKIDLLETIDGKTYTYDFGKIDIERTVITNENGEPEFTDSYSIKNITIDNENYKGPRNISIGDTLEDVLKTFPKNVVDKTNDPTIKVIYDYSKKTDEFTETVGLSATYEGDRCAIYYDYKNNFELIFSYGFSYYGFLGLRINFIDEKVSQISMGNFIYN